MIKLLVIIVAFLAGGTALAYLHFYPHSYLLLTLGNLSIETSLAVAVVLVLITGLLVSLLVSLVRGMSGIPGGIFRNWRGFRRNRRHQHLNNMVIAHLEGDHTGMLQHLKHLDNKELGEPERLSLQIHGHLQRGNPSQAAPLLDLLERKARTSAQKQLAMQLRANWWDRTGEFTKITNLQLPGKIQRQAFWRDLLANAAVQTGKWELIYQLIKLHTRPENHCIAQALTQADTDLATRIWHALSDQQRQHPSVTGAYLARLIASSKHKEAKQLILQIANTPALFALLPMLDTLPMDKAASNTMLQKMERLYKLHGPESDQDSKTGAFALALGRLCRTLALHGKAEDYLTPLLTHPDVRLSNQATIEMAKLLFQRGDIDQGVSQIQQLGAE